MDEIDVRSRRQTAPSSPATKTASRICSPAPACKTTIGSSKSIDAFSFVLASPAQSRAAASGRKLIYRATFKDKTQTIVEVPMP